MLSSGSTCIHAYLHTHVHVPHTLICMHTHMNVSHTHMHAPCTLTCMYHTQSHVCNMHICMYYIHSHTCTTCTHMHVPCIPAYSTYTHMHVPHRHTSKFMHMRTRGSEGTNLTVTRSKFKSLVRPSHSYGILSQQQDKYLVQKNGTVKQWWHTP